MVLRKSESIYLSVPGSSVGAKELVRINDARKRKAPNTYGPMEIYLSRAVAQASCCQDAKTCSSFIQIRDTVDKESSDDRVVNSTARQ